MLDVTYGTDASLYLAFESSIGALPGTPKPKNIAFVSESIKGARSLGQNQALSGDPNPLDSIPLRMTAEGPLVLQPGPLTSALMWRWILSNMTPDVSVPSASTFESILTRGKALSATVDVVLNETNELVKRVHGAIVDQCTIAVGPDGFLQHQLTIAALKTTKETVVMTGDPVVDLTTDEPYHHGQIAESDIIIDGAVANLSSLSITLNMNADKTIYVIGGGGYRQGLGRQRAAITGQIRAYLTDDTLWTMLKASEYHDVSCRWAVDATHFLTIQLPRTLLQETDPDVAGPGALMLDFQLEASKDEASETAIIVTTGNAEDGTAYAT